MYISVQVNESLSRLVVPWTVIKVHEEGLSFHLSLYAVYCATADVRNDLINFPMCMSAMKKTEAYKETKN